MSAPRIDLALSQGALALPGDGRVAVVGARAGTDLSMLPADRVEVVTGFAPDHAHFSDRGLSCATDLTGRYAAVIVMLPRAKAQAQAWIAGAVAASDGWVAVDGTRHDGVDSILRAVRARVAVTGPVNKAHGKLFWFDATAAQGAFDDWAQGAPAANADGWITAPGVFSADGVDPASALLADALPEEVSGHVIDLGAGWGYLASRALERPGITRLDLVEAEHAALECARANVTDPRAAFQWADATRWRPNASADHVITNPPFHASRTADPGLGRAFLEAAADMLKPGGRLWVVANRHLPYEDALRAQFAQVEDLGGGTRFKILAARLAARPSARATSRQGGRGSLT